MRHRAVQLATCEETVLPVANIHEQQRPIAFANPGRYWCVNARIGSATRNATNAKGRIPRSKHCETAKTITAVVNVLTRCFSSPISVDESSVTIVPLSEVIKPFRFETCFEC